MLLSNSLQYFSTSSFHHQSSLLLFRKKTKQNLDNLGREKTMSVSAISSQFAPTANASLNFRRSADYHPTVWGDHFIQFVSESTEVDEKLKQRIVSLKEKVREMLIPSHEKALQLVMVAKLIDSIQRLGLCYHFEREIDEVLQHIYYNIVDDGMITFHEDLHALALVFRLLRQQGYYISPDVFNNFKDEEGNFKQRFSTDVEGMLSLYEAAHLQIHGEDILDEAIAFTSAHLELMTTQVSPSLAAKINHSLKWPLRKNLPRLVTRHYISTYVEEPSYDENLLLLAKLDFNMLQKQYQKEVGHITKWWKDLDFAEKLPFARNRIVECYFWILGAYFEPQYSFGRRIATKMISLLSIIDDIYDVYGTLDELQLFTEAIERWDISCMDLLPEYMKHCYQALLNFFEEVEQEMSKEGKTFCIIYAKNEIKRLTQAYIVEAKWFSCNYTPTMEEYMSVALVTTTYRLLITTCFIGMGCFVTEKVFQWITKGPKIVGASTIICRLMDDIVSNEFEQERGHVPSAIQCYMKQHDVMEQHTIDECRKLVTNAWKDINEDCLDPTDIPKPLIMRVLNLSRVANVLYTDHDGYTDSKGSTKKDIEALLLNPCPI